MTVSAMPPSRPAWDVRAPAPPGLDFAGSFSDVFEDFFGDLIRAGGAPSAAIAARTCASNPEITLEEAFRGRSAEIKVPTTGGLRYPAADSGAEPGHTAGDRPHLRRPRQGARKTQGFFTIERSCAQRRGTGKVIRHPCKTCAAAPARCRRNAA